MIFFKIFAPGCHGNRVEIDEISTYFMEIFIGDFSMYFYVQYLIWKLM